MLLFASAGVLEHSGIKIPYFAFFGHESKVKTKEAPIGMVIAMVFAAFLCLLIGFIPSLLFSLLPYEVNYKVYTPSHVIGQMQLLIFAILAFIFLIRFKLYPPEIPSTVLNFDWFYRIFLYKLINSIITVLFKIWEIFSLNFINSIKFVYSKIQNNSIQSGNSAVKVGRSTVLILFSLGFVLICNYLLF